MNDLRPIAMTSSVMKSFEKCFLICIKVQVTEFIDPLQFAYVKNRSIDDALLHLLNEIYSHLETPGSSIRIMFYDFSSAFNTIQPHLLVHKLRNMKLCPLTISWILDYLTDRPQYVRLQQSSPSGLSTKISDTITTNTGAPQGTVLSPFLFILYTADCRTTRDNIIMEKYADDSSQLGKLIDDDDSHYLSEIEYFVDWCDKNYLLLNVPKTNEMIIDFRRNKTYPPPVLIKGTEVNRVDFHKHLGLIIDNKLTWNHNTTSVIKKVNTRIHCLRKLKSFNINEKLLHLFYSSIIRSSLTFCISCWGGNINQGDKNRLDRLVRKSGKIVGTDLDSIDKLRDKTVNRKLTAILEDVSHPLFLAFDRQRAPRSGRFMLPKIKTNRYLNSFLPSAIKLYNTENTRGHFNNM